MESKMTDMHREAFERWAKGKHMILSEWVNGGYMDSYTRLCWCAWQAATRHLTEQNEQMVAMSKYEPSREELEAFITRAGFRWGWENLESAARRMAEHACIELHAAHLAAQAEWPSEGDVETAARAAWNHVPRGRSWDELTKEGRDSWKEDTRASLQSVRPPIGVVSDEDVYEAVEAYVVSDKNADCPRFEAMRAALESYASRHAPTKD